MSDIFDWARRHNVAPHALAELVALIDPTYTYEPSGDEKSEAAVQAALRVRAAASGFSLWRNNNGACMDETGRLIRYGLGNDSKKLSDRWKSSDLIGITTMVSTAPGQTFGVFTAVEVKEPGWSKPKNKREVAQDNFLKTVRAKGGIGFFAQSVRDYEVQING